MVGKATTSCPNCGRRCRHLWRLGTHALFCVRCMRAKGRRVAYPGHQPRGFRGLLPISERTVARGA